MSKLPNPHQNPLPPKRYSNGERWLINNRHLIILAVLFLIFVVLPLTQGSQPLDSVLVQGIAGE